MCCICAHPLAPHALFPERDEVDLWEQAAGACRDCPDCRIRIRYHPTRARVPLAPFGRFGAGLTVPRRADAAQNFRAYMKENP